MSAIDLTTATNQSSMAFQEKYTFDGWRKMVIDYSDLTAVKGTAITQADTVKAMIIPAGVMVTEVKVRTLIPFAGTISSPTVSVGDSSAASYLVESAIDAVAQTTTMGTGTYFRPASAPYAPTGGKFYSAADYINLTFGGTFSSLTAGRFEVLVKTETIGTSLLN